jgi:hypothetical protein
MSTADAAFPSLDTPAGFAQFLWRSARMKVVSNPRELESIGQKPVAEDGTLVFSVTLTDGRRLTVAIADDLADNE